MNFCKAVFKPNTEYVHKCSHAFECREKKKINSKN